MTTVRQLLEGKGTNVWSVNPDTLIINALKLMAEKKIGALLVLEEENLVGIFSERDYARKVALHEKSPLNTPVKDIMTRKVYCVDVEQTVDNCMALMTNHRIRHLPVLENDKLAGIVTIGDIVKSVISTQEFMIEQLENYIVTSSS